MRFTKKWLNKFKKKLIYAQKKSSHFSWEDFEFSLPLEEGGREADG